MLKRFGIFKKNQKKKNLDEKTIVTLFQNKGNSLSYDPEQIPPNFKNALSHRNAKKVGIPYQESSIICPCCGIKVEKKQLNINCNLKELSYLGPGFPLFFECIQYCIIIVIALLIISGIPNLVINYYGDSCSQYGDCQNTVLNQLNLGNITLENEKLKVQIILNFVAILFVFVLSLLYRRKQEQTQIQMDDFDIAQNDYSILFHNIKIDFQPTNETEDYDEELKFYIENELKLKHNIEVKIEDVQLCYNIDIIMKLYRSKRKLIKKKQKKLKKIQKREININKKQKIAQQKFTQNQLKRNSETSIQDIKVYPNDEQSIQHGNQMKFDEKQDDNLECIKDQTNYNLIQQKQSYSNQSPLNLEAIQNKQVLEKDQNLENENTQQNKVDIASQSLTTQGSLPKKGLQGFKENVEKKLMKFQNNKTLLNLNKLDIKINKLQEEIYNLQMRYKEGKKREFMVDHFVGKAIISFETETQKDKILEIYGNKQNSFCGFLKQNAEQLEFYGQTLELEEAPYPKDIYWQNLKYNKSDQFKRQCISFGANFCGMLICLLINWLMVAWQQYNNDSHFLQNFISIIASILNSILNFVIIEMIKYLGRYEGHYTMTKYNLSVSKKISINMFINTSLMAFITQTYLEKKGNDQMEALFVNGGLLYNMFYIFISNMIVPVIVILINPMQIYKDFQIKNEAKKSKKNKCNLTQQELNNQYELVEFEISSFGARVVTNMLSLSFYLPVLPIIGFFTLISLILLYYTYKYVLLRNRSVSFQYGNEISVELTDLLEYIIPVFCASQIIFYSIVTDQTIQYILGSIGVFLGLIVVFVPMDSITKLIFKKIQSKPNVEDFQTAKQHFKTTYAQSNPAIDLIEKNLILKQAHQFENNKIQQTFEKTLQPQKYNNQNNNIDVVIEI